MEDEMEGGGGLERYISMCIYIYIHISCGLGLTDPFL